MGRNITFKLVVPVIFSRGESLILTSHLLKRLLVLHRNDEGTVFGFLTILVDGSLVLQHFDAFDVIRSYFLQCVRTSFHSINNNQRMFVGMFFAYHDFVGCRSHLYI